MFKHCYCFLLQSGKRKTLDEDSESSDECENLLEKIKRMCRNYASDEDADYKVWWFKLFYRNNTSFEITILLRYDIM